MAFLRFARDKRGVENFYLVQPTTNRRGKVRARVLYWFRSPPDVKVGREPFDVDVRRTLEQQNPGVEFDWRAIVDTPIPSADADKWRERRRADRAAKHAAAEDAARQAGADDETLDASDAETLRADTSAPPPSLADEVGSTALATPQSGDTVSRSAERDRRYRRRRRGGGRRDNNAPVTSPASDPTTEPSGD